MYIKGFAVAEPFADVSGGNGNQRRKNEKWKAYALHFSSQTHFIQQKQYF